MRRLYVGNNNENKNTATLVMLGMLFCVSYSSPQAIVHLNITHSFGNECIGLISQNIIYKSLRGDIFIFSSFRCIFISVENFNSIFHRIIFSMNITGSKQTLFTWISILHGTLFGISFHLIPGFMSRLNYCVPCSLFFSNKNLHLF